MSYFAEPKFIIYDEWFDEDFKKNKLYVQHKKTNTINNIHEFFYTKSNFKIGASENIMQLDIKLNKKDLITNNNFDNISEKYSSVSNKKFLLFKKLKISKNKFKITKKLINSLTIFSFLLIFGFILFFISQSKKNDSGVRINSFVLEKKL